MECTGVLITPRFVLSAAHCTMYIKVTSVTLRPFVMSTVPTHFRKSTENPRMRNAWI